MMDRKRSSTVFLLAAVAILAYYVLPFAYGWTPLHKATVMGAAASVAELLKQGAPVNAVTRSGDTPLHWAAGYGHEEIAALLLESGAEVNLRNSIGNTPLHIASQETRTPKHASQRVKVAEMLLNNGADLGIENDKGQTPLEVADRHSDPRLSRIMKGEEDPAVEDEQ